MKKGGRFFTLLISAMLLSACSWQEYFVVKNNSDFNVVVSYQISKVEAFPIFEEKVDVYKMSDSGGINWGKKLNVADEDTGKLGVKITLAPGSILKFGVLSNDTYSEYKQEFINGRVFNLIQMTIIWGKDVLEIKPAEFDKFFKKKKGLIEYTVK